MMVTESDIKMFAGLHRGASTKTELHKRTGITYAYVFRRVDVYEEKSLLTTRKKGRRVILEPTGKGKRVFRHAHKILEELEDGLK